MAQCPFDGDRVARADSSESWEPREKALAEKRRGPCLKSRKPDWQNRNPQRAFVAARLGVNNPPNWAGDDHIRVATITKTYQAVQRLFHNGSNQEEDRTIDNCQRTGQ